MTHENKKAPAAMVWAKSLTAPPEREIFEGSEEMIEDVATVGDFEITTNGCGEVFLSNGSVRLRIGKGKLKNGIYISYGNESVALVPTGYKTVEFVPMG